VLHLLVALVIQHIAVIRQHERDGLAQTNAAPATDDDDAIALVALRDLNGVANGVEIRVHGGEKAGRKVCERGREPFLEQTGVSDAGVDGEGGVGDVVGLEFVGELGNAA